MARYAVKWMNKKGKQIRRIVKVNDLKEAGAWALLQEKENSCFVSVCERLEEDNEEDN